MGHGIIFEILWIKRAHVSKQLRIVYGTLFIVEETIATHSLASLSAEDIQADSNQSCRKSFFILQILYCTKILHGI